MPHVARVWMGLTLMAALALVSAPAAQAEAVTSALCEPVWIDNEGRPHVNPDCLPTVGDVLYYAGLVVDLVWGTYCDLTTFIC